MVPAQLLAKSDVHPHGFRNVSPQTAHAFKDALQIVDVREYDEFVGPLGYVHGARLIPLSTVGHAADRLDRNKPVLVICRSGGRSAAAAQALARMGFPLVFNMNGGMLAWNAEGLPVRRGGDLSNAA